MCRKPAFLDTSMSGDESSVSLLEPIYFFVPSDFWNLRTCAKASDRETEGG